MKNLYILIIVLASFSINVTKSQTFDFTISPNSQNIIEGANVEFELTITPINGFDATIIYSAKVGTFSKNYLNPPYNKVKFIYSSSIGSNGIKIITINGISGNQEVSKQCTIYVAKNAYFSKVLLPGGNESYINQSQFVKDKNDNITLLEYDVYNGKYIDLHSFINEEWTKKSYTPNAGIKFNEQKYRNYQIFGDSIWYHTDDKLILVYNNFTYIYNSDNSDIKSGMITGIKLDKNGNPLLFNYYGEKTILEYYVNNNWVSLDSSIYQINSFDRHFNQLKTEDDLYNQVVFDKFNNLWIKNTNDKLIKITNTSGILETEVIETINGQAINADFLKLDVESNLWLIDNLYKKIIKFNSKIANIYDFPLEVKNIKRISINDENNIWFLNAINLIDNEVCSFNNGIYVNYAKDNIFPSGIYNIKNLFLDKFNNLWLTSADNKNHLVFNPNGLVGVPIISSVENEKIANHSLIFPNPSSDKISLDLGVVAVADLVIYDILGNEIMSIQNYANKSEIDVSNLSIGTYTIQIQTSTGSISQRLLVNR